MLTLFSWLTGIGVNAAEIEYVNGNMILSFDDVSGQYTIKRAQGRLGSFTTLATVTTNSYTDVGVEGNPYDYYYQVFDAENNLLETLSLELELFGPNMYVFRPHDNTDSINSFVNGVGDAMQYGEFSPNRYAFYFMPGDYTAADLLSVSFYTHIGGLGTVPYDTKLSNIITPPNLPDNNATQTFWRSAENFDVVGVSDGDAYSWFQWAVSQAAPLRRVHSERKAHYQYWFGGWCSGGFTGDSHFEDAAGSYSQQQWYFRNSYVEKGSEGYSSGGWNLAYQGVEFGPGVDMSLHSDNWSEGDAAWNNVSREETTPIVREKPFLFFDETENRYKVFKPGLRYESTGTSWGTSDMGPGTIYDLLNDFYVVKPGTTAPEMNAQLDLGKHLFFAPGIYEISEPLHVKNANTIILGTGYATIIPGSSNSETAILIDDVEGVTIASLLFDAHYSSRTMLQAGPNNANVDHSSNPTLLSDLFFRVGGFREENVNVDIALEINSSNVIGDHFWIWRADHGNGVGWYSNTSKNGLVVNGDNVTIYGLFNEHFQEHQTLWNGEFGELYFLQCETPYDPPSQDAYMSHDGTVNGYAAYKVADHVQHHRASMMGIYDVFVNTGGAEIAIDNSIEIGTSSDVKIHHACNVNISTLGGVNYVINGEVPSTFNKEIGARFFVVDYEGDSIPDDDNEYAPVAVIKVSRTSGFAPLGVVFDASSSSDRNGDNLTYEWNFGDGSANSTEEVVSHYFNNVDYFTVTLTVTDETGLSNSAQKTIVVKETPSITRSTKRGLGYGHHSVADMDALSKGVSWWYNWAIEPESTVANEYENLDMDFVPMTWNDYYDETALRAYLDTHPNVGYLLAFNEPNFQTQANMTPAEVAAAWPRIEAIADEYGLKIISPAVNYCDECVDIPGTDDDSSPWAYLDAFFEECQDCRVDGIAVHNYMGYKDALEWYIGEFKKYNRPIWLTEFCAWDNNPSSAQQKEFMIQSVDYLENDPDVERYAWFVGRSEGYPYNGILDYNNSGILTELGEIYVNMPVHNPDIRFEIPGRVEAENYFAMSGVQPEETDDVDGFLNMGNTEAGDYLDYNITAVGGDYPLILRVASNSGVQNTATILIDDVETATISFEPTGGWQTWIDISEDISISEGDHTVRIRIDEGAFNINWFRIGNEVVDNNPVAIINSDVEQGQIDLTVNFDASESYDPDGDAITSYFWDFGDGTTAEGVSVQHVYNQVGQFNVVLTVSNQLNGKDTVQVTTYEAQNNLALNKPATSSGIEGNMIAELAVDGNPNSRWGSNYVSPSWIKVDLQGQYIINRVVLNWERACAESYVVLVSNVDSDPVANSGDWTELVSMTGMTDAARIDELTGLIGSGQFIAVVGTNKLHPWGYSLFEFEVYGIENGTFEAPVAIASSSSYEITLPENEITLSGADSYDNDGTIVTYEWTQIDGPEGITINSPNNINTLVSNMVAGNYTFNLKVTDNDGLSDNGLVNITVSEMPDQCLLISENKPAYSSSQQGDYSASYVNDSNLGTRWSSDFNDAEWVKIDLEDEYNICQVVLNWEAAFGSDYEVRLSSVDDINTAEVIATVANGDGGIDDLTISSNASGQYIWIYGVARGTGWGYSLWEVEVYGTPATIETCNLISEGKTAAHSSMEGDYSSYRAFDGDMQTRWSSQFSDLQWISVDLGASYSICFVELYWEGASGKVYEIQLSDDPEFTSYNVIASENNGDGGTDILTTDNVPTGRYLRMHGTERNTGYGYSLWEFKVFGSSANKSAQVESNNAVRINELTEIKLYPNPVNDYLMIELGNSKDAIYDLSIIDLSGKEVINKQISKSDEVNVSGLKEGVYMVTIKGNQQKCTKIIIKK